MEKAKFGNIEFTSKFIGFDDEFLICTDRMRLKQVLLNYQSNALKFSKAGGKVTLICILKEDLIEVQVRDNGFGIKPESMPKLFKLFGFIDESKKVNQNGIGLGLYITKKIVEEFGGTVNVTSTFGEGSTFSLAFKLSSQLDEIENETRTVNPTLPRPQTSLIVS
jgi:signal transduction histidine kinase